MSSSIDKRRTRLADNEAGTAGDAKSAKTMSAKTLAIDLRKLIDLDSDPQKQAILRKLLVEEADKLASNREWLEKRAAPAAEAGQQMHEGKASIEGLNGINSPGDTCDCARAMDLKGIMQQLFENFYGRLMTVFPYSVKLRDEIVGVCGTLDEARRRAQQFAEVNPEAVVTITTGPQGRGETFDPEYC